MQSQKSILALCSEHSPGDSTSETTLFNHKRQGEAGGGGRPFLSCFSAGRAASCSACYLMEKKKGWDK